MLTPSCSCNGFVICLFNTLVLQSVKCLLHKDFLLESFTQTSPEIVPRSNALWRGNWGGEALAWALL